MSYQPFPKLLSQKCMERGPTIQLPHLKDAYWPSSHFSQIQVKVRVFWQATDNAKIVGGKEALFAGGCGAFHLQWLNIPKESDCLALYFRFKWLNTEHMLEAWILCHAELLLKFSQNSLILNLADFAQAYQCKLCPDLYLRHKRKLLSLGLNTLTMSGF